MPHSLNPRLLKGLKGWEGWEYKGKHSMVPGTFVNIISMIIVNLAIQLNLRHMFD